MGFGRGDQATEDVGFVLFSFFNVLWFSVYLEAWKRYCAELAYKWGTLDQRDELLQEPRPLFTVSRLNILTTSVAGHECHPKRVDSICLEIFFEVSAEIDSVLSLITQ